MNKLRTNRGETLIESLVSILIAVLAFAVLATSVVTAEKINAQTRKERKDNGMFSYTGAKPSGKTVTLTGESGKSGTGRVTLFEHRGYYYYNYDDNTGAGP